MDYCWHISILKYLLRPACDRKHRYVFIDIYLLRFDIKSEENIYLYADNKFVNIALQPPHCSGYHD